MQHEKEYIAELLKRYRQGLATDEEKTWIAQWLYKLDALEQSPTNEFVEQQREQSKEELKAYFFPVANRHKKIFSITSIVAVAASILLVMFAGWWYFKQPSTITETAQSIVLNEVKTAAGQMKRITLSDGTQIVLNNKSSLKYPTHFTDSTRQVYLDGEAFFEVSRNTKQPFIVESNSLHVRVLGTSFNVRSYKEDHSATVSVATGKVGVSTLQNREQQLVSGEEILLDKRSDRFTKSGISSKDIGSWQQGRLIFKDEKLSEITAQLARKFNVQFEYKNPELKEKALNLRIENQPLSTILKALSISGEFQYQKNGDTIVLWK